MTITLTIYKSKEFVILASSSETKDLVTATPYSFLLTLNHSTNGQLMLNHTRSSLFRMTITLPSYKAKEFVILASSSETKDLVTATPYSFLLTLNHSTNRQ